VSSSVISAHNLLHNCAAFAPTKQYLLFIASVGVSRELKEAARGGVKRRHHHLSASWRATRRRHVVMRLKAERPPWWTFMNGESHTGGGVEKGQRG